MALSGTLTGNCDNTNYSLTCEWSATQNITNNTSTITAKVYLKAPSGWSTDSDHWYCTINGTQVTEDKPAIVSSTKVLLGQKTWTVTHSSSGTCSTTISFSYLNGLTSSGTHTTKKGSGSGSITLNTIPRTSSFTLSKTSMDMGASQTVTISRASSSFTHTVQYTFGGSTTTTHDKTTSTSVSFTPPISLATKIPNTTSGTCTVKVTTYNGSTVIGSTSKTFTLTVPSSVKPTVTLATTINNDLNGLMLSGKSTIKITPTGTGSQGSTISSYTYSGAGLSGTGSSKTTRTLNTGSYTVTVTVKDSRGRTNTASTSFTVHAYSSPTCSISVYRCNSDGTANPSGTYAKLKLTWNVSNPNSANTNTHTFKIEWKKTSDTTWSSGWKSGTLANYSSTNYLYDGGSNWATTTSYNFRFTVTDSFGSTSAICTLSTINALLNLEKNGVGIGKIYERGKLDVNGAVYIQGGALRFTGSPSQYSRIGYNSSSENDNGVGCTFIANGSNNWLRLNDDGGITWRGYDVLTSNGTQTITGTLKTGTYANLYQGVTFKRKTDEIGNYLGKIGCSVIGTTEPTVTIEVGKVADTSNDSFADGFRRFSFSPNYFLTHVNNTVNIGSSNYRFKAVYATNGTIQTSDGRYKYILENIKNEKCYNLIRDMNLYGYSTLNKRIDEYINTTEISDELQQSSQEDMNLHMGFVAQEIEDNELAKYILIKDDLENGGYIYGVDNYAYTTVVHGALQYEIKLREKLEKEIEDLKRQIRSLKE